MGYSYYFREDYALRVTAYSSTTCVILWCRVWCVRICCIHASCELHFLRFMRAALTRQSPYSAICFGMLAHSQTVSKRDYEYDKWRSRWSVTMRDIRVGGLREINLRRLKNEPSASIVVLLASRFERVRIYPNECSVIGRLTSEANTVYDTQNATARLRNTTQRNDHTQCVNNCYP